MVVTSDKITSFSGNNVLKCGNIFLRYDKPLVMGILNLTPDSFYDRGRYTNEGMVIAQTEKMLNDGASIIDLGAVSSRPGALFISEDTELFRLIPNLEILKKRFPETVFSVDTFRAKVVKSAAEIGVGIINDISGGNMDENLISSVVETGLPYILMHMKGSPLTMQTNPQYEDVTFEINNFFNENLVNLSQAGIKQIILDPGFGFGKTLEHNYSILNNLNVFKKSGNPLLIGLSRKSMIYRYLNIKPEDALSATSALHMLALLKGADILRVHDVKEAVEVIKLVEMLTKVEE